MDEKCRVERDVTELENEIPSRCFIQIFRLLKPIAHHFSLLLPWNPKVLADLADLFYLHSMFIFFFRVICLTRRNGLESSVYVVV